MHRESKRGRGRWFYVIHSFHANNIRLFPLIEMKKKDSRKRNDPKNLHRNHVENAESGIVFGIFRLILHSDNVQLIMDCA